MIEGCMFKASHGATIADDPSAVFDYVADASRQRSVVIAAAMASNVVTSITPKIATHVVPRLAPTRHGSVAAVAMSLEVCGCRRRLADRTVGAPRHQSSLGGGTNPPFRRILESGVRMCLASDAMNVARFTPFVRLWYAVSGRTFNPAVPDVPADQRLTCAQALRASTADRAWNLDQEGRLGSSPASTLT